MRTRAQEEQEKPPAARTRRGGRQRLPMASKSTQEKRKTPPKTSASKPAKKNKTPRSSPATVSSAGAGAGAAPAPASSTKTPRPRNFGNIEDQLLCRAYVNVSCNPVVGTDQKRKIFWESIKYRYEDLYTREGVTEEDGKVERTWDALANRYQKKIQPEMNVFMAFYKRVAECPPSGVPPEEWPKIAATNFGEFYDKPFKFLHCVSILQQLPKFDPMGADDEVIDLLEAGEDDGDDGDDMDKKPAAKGSTNKIGKPMGAQMARPIGQKAAKKAAADETMEERKLKAIKNMAEAHSQLAKSVDVSTKIEEIKTKIEEIKMYKDMGMMEEAKSAIAELKQLKSQATEAAASVASASAATTPVPKIVVQELNDDNEVEILEEDPKTTNDNEVEFLEDDLPQDGEDSVGVGV